MPNPADVSMTDANNYVGPPTDPNAPPSIYPRWIYHPTLPNQIVANLAAEVALRASDPLWYTIDNYATQ